MSKLENWINSWTELKCFSIFARTRSVTEGGILYCSDVEAWELELDQWLNGIKVFLRFSIFARTGSEPQRIQSSEPEWTGGVRQTRHHYGQMLLAYSTYPWIYIYGGCMLEIWARVDAHGSVIRCPIPGRTTSLCSHSNKPPNGICCTTTRFPNTSACRIECWVKYM